MFSCPICYREAFIRLTFSSLDFFIHWFVKWVERSLKDVISKMSSPPGVSGTCPWRYASRQSIMLSILKTGLFRACSCLGGLQPELPNYLLHGRVAVTLDQSEVLQATLWQDCSVLACSCRSLDCTEWLAKIHLFKKLCLEPSIVVHAGNPRHLRSWGRKITRPGSTWLQNNILFPK